MPARSITALLAGERFLNYCFHRNAADVQYWEEQLVASSAAEQKILTQAKTLALLLAAEAGPAEANAHYQLLKARLVPPAPSTRLPFWRLRLGRRLRVVALSVTVASVSTAGLYWYTTQHIQTSQPVGLKLPDVAPGGYQAVLILADGRRVTLGTTIQDTVARQPGVAIAQTSVGQLAYRMDATAPRTTRNAPPVYNILETPPRGQFEVVLPDGSHVWLNAQSRLRYPTTFASGVARRVQLAGEAYFEVAQHVAAGGRRLPFIVETQFSPGDPRSQRVEVLGTHFNVASYADEPQAVTTLLEGSVRASPQAAGTAYVLAPGQQLSTGAQGARRGPADVEAAVAWKNGDFVFREDLHTALRKIARWYNVEVVYTDSAPKQLQLGGWISRKKNLSEVLHLLEATGRVHFTLTERRILVTE